MSDALRKAIETKARKVLKASKEANAPLANGFTGLVFGLCNEFAVEPAIIEAIVKRVAAEENVMIDY